MYKELDKLKRRVEILEKVVFGFFKDINVSVEIPNEGVILNGAYIEKNETTKEDA